MAHRIITPATASPTTDPNAPTGTSIAIAALDDLLPAVDAVGEPGKFPICVRERANREENTARAYSCILNDILWRSENDLVVEMRST